MVPQTQENTDCGKQASLPMHEEHQKARSFLAAGLGVHTSTAQGKAFWYALHEAPWETKGFSTKWH